MKIKNIKALLFNNLIKERQKKKKDRNRLKKNDY